MVIENGKPSLLGLYVCSCLGAVIKSSNDHEVLQNNVIILAVTTTAFLLPLWLHGVTDFQCAHSIRVTDSRQHSLGNSFPVWCMIVMLPWF